jgi:hypothetical protein
MQAPRSVIYFPKQSKLAVFPKRPQKPTRRVSRAFLQSAMRDRLRAYRADDCTSFALPGWTL